MNKKRWALLVLIAIAVFGYFKLFYKTYSTTAVAKSADCIVALDVKRITNTIIWNVITTPSQWKKISFYLVNKKEINWKDMVIIPDYILAFHIPHQPASVWYATLRVKDEDDFAKGLQVYHFEKQNSNTYSSKDAGIQFYKAGNKVLVTNAPAEDSNYLTQTAHELFTNKEYIAQPTLEKVIAAKSHLAVYIAANNFLLEDAVVVGNFDKNKIELTCAATPKKQFSFIENNFNCNSTSLCTLTFTQPSDAVFSLLSNTDKSNISKMLNQDIDSVFLPGNKNYSLDISDIKTRTDSAISYSYDNDFNKVEKTVVNTLQEPAFNFTISGDSVTHIYNYWQHNNKLALTDAGQLFTSMPFVKSYCIKKSATELNITAANYQPASINKNIQAILFFKLILTKIPDNLLRYVPDGIVKAITNLESIQLTLNKENQQLYFNCIFQKQKNDLPVIDL